MRMMTSASKQILFILLINNTQHRHENVAQPCDTNLLNYSELLRRSINARIKVALYSFFASQGIATKGASTSVYYLKRISILITSLKTRVFE